MGDAVAIALKIATGIVFRDRKIAPAGVFRGDGRQKLSVKGFAGNFRGQKFSFHVAFCVYMLIYEKKDESPFFERGFCRIFLFFYSKLSDKNFGNVILLSSMLASF